MVREMQHTVMLHYFFDFLRKEEATWKGQQN